MNSSQQAVVDSTATNILCVAGPGSGKTTTLVARIARFVETGTDPRDIVCITFTNEAGKMLREKLAFIGVEIRFAGTLHAYALEFLSRHGEAPVVLSERTATTALKNAMTATKCRESFKRMRLCIAGLERPGAKEAPALARYFSMLAEANAVDYDTLLIRFRDHLRDKPRDHAPVHLFVDEYQDSAPIDAEIYRFMPRHSFMAIGDPNQAIYAFRGATTANIRELYETATVYFLSENYRSKATICRMTDRLISHNRSTIISRGQRSMIGEGGKLNRLVFTGPEAEAQAIARRVKGGGEGTWGIFTRYNAHREAITAAFINAGLLAPEAQADPELTKLAALVQLWGNPESRLLQHAYLDVVHGETEATRIMGQAAREGRSPIAPAIAATPVDTQAMIAALLAARLSRAAVAAARRAVDAAGHFSIRAISIALREAGDETDGGGFTISTFHGSKGLEFDNVWIAGAEHHLTPAAKKGEALEEERRLFYVALTRARTNVFLSRVERRPDAWAPGKLVSPRFSCFVDELA